MSMSSLSNLKIIFDVDLTTFKKLSNLKIKIIIDVDLTTFKKLSNLKIKRKVLTKRHFIVY
jgi:hypothetical protein